MFAMLAAAAALTLGVTSCSKDDNGGAGNGGDGVEGAPARMSVTFKVPETPGVRAVTSPQETNTAESTINSISVFVFKSTGVAASTGGYTTVTSTGFTGGGGVYTLDNDISTESGTGMKVYVAMNLPTTADKAYGSEAALLAAVETVANMSDATATPNNGFTMFSALETMNLAAYDSTDPTTVGKATLDISRVVSKVVASAGALTYTPSAWSNGVEFEYALTDFNVYQDATSSYLVSQATSSGPLSTFAASVNNTLVAMVTDPANAAGRAAMSGFYVGENKTASALQGNSTYAMISATVIPNMAAEWDASANAVVWNPATTYGGGVSGSNIFIVKTNGYTYVTDSDTKADGIVNALNAIAAGSASKYTYTDGYVHFMVYLNAPGYQVNRNQFIHVMVNGIKSADGLFPGIPGDPTDPTKPVNPEGPDNPDPVKPVDPIVPDAAMLNVEITVDPWEYTPQTVTLE